MFNNRINYKYLCSEIKLETCSEQNKLEISSHTQEGDFRVLDMIITSGNEKGINIPPSQKMANERSRFNQNNAFLCF